MWTSNQPTTFKGKGHIIVHILLPRLLLLFPIIRQNIYHLVEPARNRVFKIGLVLQKAWRCSIYSIGYRTKSVIANTGHVVANKQSIRDYGRLPETFLERVLRVCKSHAGMYSLQMFTRSAGPCPTKKRKSIEDHAKIEQRNWHLRFKTRYELV